VLKFFIQDLIIIGAKRVTIDESRLNLSHYYPFRNNNHSQFRIESFTGDREDDFGLHTGFFVFE
jgi:hypothetical protein